MSSWKKASKSNQKVHRERHQPESRKHLGLLEKKKDYKVRARDAHQKEKTLKLLHYRALNKNPDEFYHHMINSKLKDGEHYETEKEPDEHSKNQLALMKTQDLKYITMKRTIEKNKINRLQSQLHLLDYANTVPNKHTFFDDKGKPQVLDKQALAKRLDTHPDLLARKTNRLRLEQLDTHKPPELTKEEQQKAQMLKDQSYNELKKRIEREKELAIAQQKLEIKRTLEKPRLLKPVRVSRGTKTAAPVYKFRYERKK